MPVTPNRSTAHRARGVTLVELLVAVMILVIMILAFSAILSQGEMVVTTSQRIIRANAQAAAIAQVFRRDITSITTDGFLRISGTGNPALFCTSVGPFVASDPPVGVPDVRANAAIICYRLAASGDILCREAYLLTTITGSTSGDILNNTLSDIEHDRKTADSISTTLNLTTPDTVPTLPKTLAEVKQTWPILMVGCTNVSVQYRTLNAATGVLSGWLTGSGNWSHSNRTNWPVLIKLKYTLAGEDFEVVCPLGG